MKGVTGPTSDSGGVYSAPLIGGTFVVAACGSVRDEVGYRATAPAGTRPWDVFRAPSTVDRELWTFRTSGGRCPDRPARRPTGSTSGNPRDSSARRRVAQAPRAELPAGAHATDYAGRDGQQLSSVPDNPATWCTWSTRIRNE